MAAVQATGPVAVDDAAVAAATTPSSCHMQHHRSRAAFNKRSNITKTRAIEALYQSADGANNSSSSTHVSLTTDPSLFTSSSGSVQSFGAQQQRLYQQHISSSTGSSSPAPALWPLPTTGLEVKQLVTQVRATRDTHQQLVLCRQMMRQAAELNQAEKQRSDSTLELDKALLRDALQTHTRHLLRRLARGGPAPGSRGSGEAQFLLGSCVGSGALGFDKDVFKACAWYEQAAKLGYNEATFRAGVCYEYGAGTRQDYGRAVAYYDKGARMGHVPCMYRLGVILLRGYCRQTPQPRTAIAWLQRAVDARSDAHALPCALHALAMVQLTGECNRTSLIPDTAYALQLLERAASLGHVSSMCKLGECYETGDHVEHPDDVRSIYWYSCAAQHGCPHAALALSGWYLTGSYTPGVLDQSDRESLLWAQYAASASAKIRDYYEGPMPVRETVANACFVVAHYLEHGVGVQRPADPRDTRVWYRRAAALGHERAASRLKGEPDRDDTSSSTPPSSSSSAAAATPPLSNNSNSSSSSSVKSATSGSRAHRACVIM